VRNHPGWGDLRGLGKKKTMLQPSVGTSRG
jgi:hypothetical protein